MHGLPLQYTNQENMRRIKSLISSVNEVQGDISLNHIETRFIGLVLRLM